MPRSRTSKIKRVDAELLSVDVEKDAGGHKAPSRPKLHKVDDVLSVVFHLLWIVIGAFFVLVIIGQIRQGALNSVLGRPPQSSSVNSVPDAPTETELPGVGTVNIDCTKQALSTEAIQKILEAGDTSTLTADEKAKLDPCIVAAQSPTSSPSVSSK